MFTFVANSEDNNLDKTQQVRITYIDGPLVKGEFTGLSESAIKQGLHKVYIEGKITNESTNAIGTKTLNIEWLRVVDKVTDEKVYLDVPLETPNLLVAPDIEVDDMVSVRGDLDSVISKQQEIVEKNVESSKETIVEEKSEEAFTPKKTSGGGSSSGISSGGSSGGSSLEEPEKQAFDAVIEGNKKVVVTADGCDIVADKGEMVANQYKRILEDGEEIQPCSPSDVKYDLTPDYTVCSPYEDLDAKKAFERYTLGYQKDSESTRIVIDGGYCNVDDDTVVDMNQQVCGNEVDYDTLQYFNKNNLTYTIAGKSYVAQECVRDNSSAIALEKDTSTCSASFDNGFYTPFYNWYIMLDGKYTSMSDCLPDRDNQIPLQEEVCTESDKYVYDYDNELVYLKKTYFYMDGENKVTIQNCAKSTETLSLNVEIDNDVCPAINDDVAKTTTHRGYYFFNDENNQRVDIKDRCKNVEPAVPYTQGDNLWGLKTQTTTDLTLSLNDTVYVNDLGRNSTEMSRGGWVTDHYNWKVRPSMLKNDRLKMKHYMYKSESCDRETSATGDVAGALSGVSYCLHNKITDPLTFNGQPIDFDNSTENVWFDRTVTGPSSSVREYSYKGYWHYETPNGISLCRNMSDAGLPDSTANQIVSCTKPRCTVSQLELYPTYTRGDGSVMEDKTMILDEKYICGDGSNLIGTVGTPTN
tara:strand:- start:10404 stop:12491 length:2088 start_codon:yes stop_codon:yes gene_type:complete